MIDRGVVDWSVVNSMVGNYWGMVNSMSNNRSMVDNRGMVNNWGMGYNWSMGGKMGESCKWYLWFTIRKGDYGN